MFPPFIDSFGDQFGAVMINALGTIFSGFISGIINAFVSGFLIPIFQTLATALGSAAFGA
jgi:hypothetical protein